MILRLTPAGNFWYSRRVRLLFVADGRSPIALNWMRYFVERGDEVYLASTFVCAPDVALAGLEVTPVAYSGVGLTSRRAAGGMRPPRRWLEGIRHLLGPLTVARAARRLRQFQTRIQPRLVHAMRIPFEGMLAADASGGTPLLVSIWGNDLTLHGPSTALMRHYTSWTLQVADALHADCRRDVRLGRSWGFDSASPTLVIPGNGGVRTEIFRPPASLPESPVVFNPRGARTYVRTDVFLQSIPLVLARQPNARFVCASLADDADANRWVDRLGIRHAVQLLPQVSQLEMARLYQGAQVVVSPSTHDGTPNSLLEGMASGCLPVAGDLESIREWIDTGKNGLLVDPANPHEIARAVLEALQNKNLRLQAAGLNQQIITQRAEYKSCMDQAGRFYSRLISGA
jgi:hypothetical protein